MNGAAAVVEVDQAVLLLRAGRVDQAMESLFAAERRGQREASMVLADAFLRGQHVEHDAPRAIRHLERAAEQPWGPPEHLLAAIHRIGHGIASDDAAAWHWLGRAMAVRHPPSLRLAGLLRHVAGDPVPAEFLYLEAARRGDPFALHALGLLAAEGGAPERAAELWAASSLAVSRRRLGPVATPPRRRTTAAAWDARSGEPPWVGISLEGQRELLREDPRVEVCRDAIAAVECDYLITIIGKHLRRSLVLDPVDGGAVPDPIRTSSEASANELLPDFIPHLVTQRAAAFAGLPVERAEPLAMLRYGPGEEYRQHYDWLTQASLTSGPGAGLGQRLLSVVVYLNEVEQGGGTGFPTLGLTVAPVEGAMLCFANTTAAGAPDLRSVHCGEPVVRGEKYICTAWFRAVPITPAVRSRMQR